MTDPDAQTRGADAEMGIRFFIQSMLETCTSLPKQSRKTESSSSLCNGGQQGFSEVFV